MANLDGDDDIVDKKACELLNEKIVTELDAVGNVEAKRLRQLIVVRAVLDTSILLAFGLLFPPVGIIIGVSMIKDLINVRCSVGRLVEIQASTKNGVILNKIKKFLQTFEKEMMGWNDIVMSQLASNLLVIAYPLALCVFDTLGSEVGAIQALWIFIVMALAPSWISILIYLSGRIMRYFGLLEESPFLKTATQVDDDSNTFEMRESSLYMTQQNIRSIENPINAFG
jgi:hypothetical protein